MKLRPFALERWFAPREFVARYHLSSSDCEPLALASLLARASQEHAAAWSELRLGYTETRGSSSLRAGIAPLYGVDVDDVLCVTPSEGITLAMHALLRPGDVVVVALPAYQSLFEIAQAKGCEIRAWLPREEGDGWRFALDDLQKLVVGAALVVVNFPHNPSRETSARHRGAPASRRTRSKGQDLERRRRAKAPRRSRARANRSRRRRSRGRSHRARSRARALTMDIFALNDDDLLKDTPIGDLRVEFRGSDVMVCVVNPNNESHSVPIHQLREGTSVLDALYGKRFFEAEAVRAIYQSRDDVEASSRERAREDLNKDLRKDFRRLLQNGDRDVVIHTLGRDAWCPAITAHMSTRFAASMTKRAPFTTKRSATN